MLILGLLTCGVALFSAWRMDVLVQRLTSKNMVGIRAAEELAIALLEQRELVASFILSRGDRRWEEELDRREPAFQVWLAKARQNATTSEAQMLISELAEVYQSYNFKREEAIALYKLQHVTRARKILFDELNSLYKKANELCEQFIRLSESEMDAAILEDRQRIRHYTIWVSASTAVTVFLGLGLIWMFVRGVVMPLRNMAKDARAFAGDKKAMAPVDEMRDLGVYLHAMMSNVQETRSVLAQNRNLLLQSEKLASVGKLAASVAHEIRNPLTSIKMRLFAIGKMAGRDPLYEDDLRVVSEEFLRMENIIRNFLDFSRPAEPRPQRLRLVDLIDRTLELLGSSLDAQNISVSCEFEEQLPDVWADPGQMMQVLLNLLRNAAEAILSDGTICISTTSETDGAGQCWGVVRIHDTGSGIPDAIKDRIFEPFFTTKEGGTGLGLCIAAQIMAHHGGRLELDTSSAQGTVFLVRIPTAQGAQDE